MQEQYDELLRKCFELAAMAKGLGDGPFGALITDENGEIIAQASNTTNTDNSVTYHAEINAIQQAEYRRSKGKLKGCTLVSSAEPCPMCAAAIIWSGIDKVVYGASIEGMSKNGIRQIDIACRELFEKAERRIEVTGPLFEEQALSLFS